MNETALIDRYLLGQLSPEDRTAMAEYLKSLPPVEGPPRPKKAEKAS